MLVEYIKDELISNPDVVLTSTLTYKLKDMHSKEPEKIKDSTKKHTHQKLKKAFGDEQLIISR